MRKNNQTDSNQNQNRPDNERIAGNSGVPGQLIPEKGEEYLREVANIEDTPSPAEDKEAEDAMRSSNQGQQDQVEDPRRSKDGPLPGSL